MLRPNRCIETTSRACRKTAGRSSVLRRAFTDRAKRKKPPRLTLVSRRYGLRPTCRSRAPACVSPVPELNEGKAFYRLAKRKSDPLPPSRFRFLAAIFCVACLRPLHEGGPGKSGKNFVWRGHANRSYKRIVGSLRAISPNLPN